MAALAAAGDNNGLLVEKLHTHTSYDKLTRTRRLAGRRRRDDVCTFYMVRHNTPDFGFGGAMVVVVLVGHKPGFW